MQPGPYMGPQPPYTPQPMQQQGGVPQQHPPPPQGYQQAGYAPTGYPQQQQQQHHHPHTQQQVQVRPQPQQQQQHPAPQQQQSQQACSQMTADKVHVAKDYMRKYYEKVMNQDSGFVQEHSRARAKKLSIDEFEQLNLIGRGAFGEVRLAYRKDDPTKTIVALKTLRKDYMIRKKQVLHVRAERELLVEARSAAGFLNPWVVELYCTFQDEQYLYFVMEFCPGGDMMTWLMKEDIFKESAAKFYIAELVLAVESLHRMQYAHRDLKPDNILLDHSGHIKLTDFGLCKQAPGARGTELEPPEDGAVSDSDPPGGAPPGSSGSGSGVPHDKQHNTNDGRRVTWQRMRHQRELFFSTVGSPGYIAPEVLAKNGYGMDCDYWSIGIILYEMLCGYPPFYPEDHITVEQKILRWRTYLEFPTGRDSISPEATDLIRGLLEEPSRRLNFQQIVQHPFFTGIDWVNIRNKRAPFSIELSSETDCHYFDTIDETHRPAPQPGAAREGAGAGGAGAGAGVGVGDDSRYLFYGFTSKFNQQEKSEEEEEIYKLPQMDEEARRRRTLDEEEASKLTQEERQSTSTKVSSNDNSPGESSGPSASTVKGSGSGGVDDDSVIIIDSDSDDEGTAGSGGGGEEAALEFAFEDEDEEDTANDEEKWNEEEEDEEYDEEEEEEEEEEGYGAKQPKEEEGVEQSFELRPTEVGVDLSAAPLPFAAPTWKATTVEPVLPSATTGTRQGPGEFDLSIWDDAPSPLEALEQEALGTAPGASRKRQRAEDVPQAFAAGPEQKNEKPKLGAPTSAPRQGKQFVEPPAPKAVAVESRSTTTEPELTIRLAEVVTNSLSMAPAGGPNSATEQLLSKFLADVISINKAAAQPWAIPASAAVALHVQGKGEGQGIDTSIFLEKDTGTHGAAGSTQEASKALAAAFSKLTDSTTRELQQVKRQLVEANETNKRLMQRNGLLLRHLNHLKEELSISESRFQSQANRLDQLKLLEVEESAHIDITTVSQLEGSAPSVARGPSQSTMDINNVSAQSYSDAQQAMASFGLTGTDTGASGGRTTGPATVFLANEYKRLREANERLLGLYLELLGIGEAEGKRVPLESRYSGALAQATSGHQDTARAATTQSVAHCKAVLRSLYEECRALRAERHQWQVAANSRRVTDAYKTGQQGQGTLSGSHQPPQTGGGQQRQPHASAGMFAPSNIHAVSQELTLAKSEIVKLKSEIERLHCQLELTESKARVSASIGNEGIASFFKDGRALANMVEPVFGWAMDLVPRKTALALVGGEEEEVGGGGVDGSRASASVLDSSGRLTGSAGPGTGKPLYVKLSRSGSELLVEVPPRDISALGDVSGRLSARASAGGSLFSPPSDTSTTVVKGAGSGAADSSDQTKPRAGKIVWSSLKRDLSGLESAAVVAVLTTPPAKASTTTTGSSGAPPPQRAPAPKAVVPVVGVLVEGSEQQKQVQVTTAVPIPQPAQAASTAPSSKADEPSTATVTTATQQVEEEVKPQTEDVPPPRQVSAAAVPATIQAPTPTQSTGTFAFTTVQQPANLTLGPAAGSAFSFGAVGTGTPSTSSAFGTQAPPSAAPSAAPSAFSFGAKPPGGAPSAFGLPSVPPSVVTGSPTATTAASSVFGGGKQETQDAQQQPRGEEEEERKEEDSAAASARPSDESAEDSIPEQDHSVSGFVSMAWSSPDESARQHQTTAASDDEQKKDEANKKAALDEPEDEGGERPAIETEEAEEMEAEGEGEEPEEEEPSFTRMLW